MKHGQPIVVIGGGHAGCEAAAAIARMGVQAVLLTMRTDAIGAMSCNPSIGGIGKGHLVRELDVFDGIMARAADRAAIHRRMLNASKGAAVRGPRVQADRALYRTAVQEAVRREPNIAVVQGQADRLEVKGDTITGIVLADGRTITAGAVVIAAGTFLNGRLHCGKRQTVGGRVGEGAAATLGDQLREIAPVGRLKTGTPPRLDGRTIDWSRLARQPSDRRSWTMSPLSSVNDAPPQIACGTARTTARTHDLIRDALHLSPIYSGAIAAGGPRYCPSIEDKVVRFGDRDGHRIFLEPEGLNDTTVYPNGISTSLPAHVQEALVRSIAGLERAAIVQPGYAVEYDHIDPRRLSRSLALRDIPNLFCAGQINGTTGYEEAAAQGLVAGLNAAAAMLEHPPVLFERHDSYIGVMIDDLILQGINEPYRMLTGRAEHRLHLRSDNAHTRLGAMAEKLGVIGDRRRAYLHKLRDDKVTVAEEICGEEIGIADLLQADQYGGNGGVDALAGRLMVDRVALEEVIYDHLYAPYVSRQQAEVDTRRRSTDLSLAAISSFDEVRGLSREMVELLEAARPATLAEAGRIRGITPAALTALMVAARRAA